MRKTRLIRIKPFQGKNYYPGSANSWKSSLLFLVSSPNFRLAAMDSLRLPSLNALTVTHSSFQKEQSAQFLGKLDYFNSSMSPSLKLGPLLRTHRFVCQSSVFSELCFMLFFSRKKKRNRFILVLYRLSTKYFSLKNSVGGLSKCKLKMKTMIWSKWETWLLQRGDGTLW